MNVFEDKTGRCASISFYNCLPRLEKDLINWRFKEGTKIRIKEPYYKFSMGGNITIRIDYATDLEFFEDLDMKDAMKSKVRGNTFFEKGLYHEAILAYTCGIELCPPVSLLSTLLCNRAFCYMHIQNYTAAIQGIIFLELYLSIYLKFQRSLNRL